MHYFSPLVVDNFTSASKLFARTLQISGTCLSVSNNLCGNLVWSLEWPIKFDEKFRIFSVAFFVSDFNILSYALDNFNFKLLFLNGEKLL